MGSRKKFGRGASSRDQRQMHPSGTSAGSDSNQPGIVSSLMNSVQNRYSQAKKMVSDVFSWPKRSPGDQQPNMHDNVVYPDAIDVEGDNRISPDSQVKAQEGNQSPLDSGKSGEHEIETANANDGNFNDNKETSYGNSAANENPFIAEREVAVPLNPATPDADYGTYDGTNVDIDIEDESQQSVSENILSEVVGIEVNDYPKAVSNEPNQEHEVAAFHSSAEHSFPGVAETKSPENLDPANMNPNVFHRTMLGNAGFTIEKDESNIGDNDETGSMAAQESYDGRKDGALPGGNTEAESEIAAVTHSHPTDTESKSYDSSSDVRSFDYPISFQDEIPVDHKDQGALFDGGVVTENALDQMNAVEIIRKFVNMPIDDDSSDDESSVERNSGKAEENVGSGADNDDENGVASTMNFAIKSKEIDDADSGIGESGAVKGKGISLDESKYDTQPSSIYFASIDSDNVKAEQITNEKRYSLPIHDSTSEAEHVAGKIRNRDEWEKDEDEGEGTDGTSAEKKVKIDQDISDERNDIVEPVMDIEISLLTTSAVESPIETTTTSETTTASSSIQVKDYLSTSSKMTFSSTSITTSATSTSTISILSSDIEFITTSSPTASTTSTYFSTPVVTATFTTDDASSETTSTTYHSTTVSSDIELRMTSSPFISTTSTMPVTTTNFKTTTSPITSSTSTYFSTPVMTITTQDESSKTTFTSNLFETTNSKLFFSGVPYQNSLSNPVNHVHLLSDPQALAIIVAASVVSGLMFIFLICAFLKVRSSRKTSSIEDPLSDVVVGKVN